MQWGRWVRWCMAMGGTEFCQLCVLWNRFWLKHVLGKNPTFVTRWPF